MNVPKVIHHLFHFVAVSECILGVLKLPQSTFTFKVPENWLLQLAGLP